LISLNVHPDDPPLGSAPVWTMSAPRARAICCVKKLVAWVVPNHLAGFHRRIDPVPFAGIGRPFTDSFERTNRHPGLIESALLAENVPHNVCFSTSKEVTWCLH
jgi:hypothetical protein